VKQIYLQHNVALSLIAAILLKICRKGPGCTTDGNTAASFQLENIFKDFELLTMRRFVARAWFTFS